MRQSPHRTGWLAPRQDSIEAMRPENDDSEIAGMLRMAAHRRKCHMVGHRGCSKCTPERCGECKELSMVVWASRKWELCQAGTALIREARKAEKAKTPAVDQDSVVWLLLVLASGVGVDQ